MSLEQRSSEFSRTTRPRRIGTAQPPPPETARDLATAILAVISRYRDFQGSNASTDVALALAIAERESFRRGRR